MLMRGSTFDSQRGSHQLALPNFTMTAGTSRQRTMVASIAMATAKPMPNSLTVGSPLSTKLVNTQTMISAAEVITRPVDAEPVDHGLGRVARLLPMLLDLREQEHLVVHREAEQDREHQ